MQWPEVLLCLEPRFSCALPGIIPEYSARSKAEHRWVWFNPFPLDSVNHISIHYCFYSRPLVFQYKTFECSCLKTEQNLLQCIKTFVPQSQLALQKTSVLEVWVQSDFEILVYCLINTISSRGDDLFPLCVSKSMESEFVQLRAPAVHVSKFYS